MDMLRMRADLDDDDFGCVVGKRVPDCENGNLGTFAMVLDEEDYSCIVAGTPEAKREVGPSRSSTKDSDASTHLGSASTDIDNDSDVETWSDDSTTGQALRRVRFIDEAVGGKLEEVQEIPLCMKRKPAPIQYGNLSDFFSDSDEDDASGSDIVTALARLMR
jgi:hypothetical protein